MKRLLILVFLSGLYITTQAVNITVVRLTGKAEEVEKVDVVKFPSSNKIQLKLINGKTKDLDQVRTITFDDIDTAFDFINTPSLSLKKFANTIKY